MIGCPLENHPGHKNRDTPATNTFIVKAVAKRHRDLFSLLGIVKLPKRLDRFS